MSSSPLVDPVLDMDACGKMGIVVVLAIPLNHTVCSAFPLTQLQNSK